LGSRDNVEFLEEFASTMKDVDWHAWKILHLPNILYKKKEKSIMKFKRVSLAKMLLNLLPSDNSFLYSFCNQYACRYKGEGDGNIKANGELRLMRKGLPKCHTVFDIGANVGQWAKLSLQINPRLNLHCFEPSGATFQRLISNQFPSNVICNNLGLSSAPGETSLHVFSEGSALNSLYQRQGLEGYGILPQQKKETIRLETMDTYCEAHDLQKSGVDFCKIDVEGHELEVFKGMKGMLSKKTVKLIQFEYGGCNIDSRVLLKDIFDFFKLYEYTFYKIFPKRLLKVPQYDQCFENFQYQNWVIIANGYTYDE